jgi:hypothetical protein
MGYQKPNSGSIYVNGYKQKDDQPDWTGNVLFDAAFLQELINSTEVGQSVKIAISGWNNTLPSGDQVINVSFKKPWVKKTEPKPEPKPEPELDDSDLPF